MRINVTIKTNLHIISCRLMPQKKDEHLHHHCTTSECSFEREADVPEFLLSAKYYSQLMVLSPHPPPQLFFFFLPLPLTVTESAKLAVNVMELSLVTGLYERVVLPSASKWFYLKEGGPDQGGLSSEVSLYSKYPHPKPCHSTPFPHMNIQQQQ